MYEESWEALPGSDETRKKPLLLAVIIEFNSVTMPPKLNSGEAKGRAWELQKIESNSFWSTISVAQKSDI